MIFNILHDSDIQVNNSLSTCIPTVSGINLLCQQDKDDSAYTIDNATVVLDIDFGSAYDLNTFDYYSTGLTTSNVFLEYGTRSRAEKIVPISSSGTFGCFYINDNARYLRLTHESSLVSQVNLLHGIGSASDVLYFSGFSHNDSVVGGISPVGSLKSRPVDIKVTNDSFVDKLAAVSVTPTVSGYEDHYLLSTEKPGGYTNVRETGFVFPNFMPLDNKVDSLTSYDSNYWDLINKSGCFCVFDNAGLNIYGSRYGAGWYSRATSLPFMSNFIGLITNDIYSFRQSFTVSVDIKLKLLRGTIYNPDCVYLGITNTTPSRDFIGRQQDDFSFNRAGNTLISSWLGGGSPSTTTDTQAPLYVGGVYTDGSFEAINSSITPPSSPYLTTSVLLNDFQYKLFGSSAIYDSTENAPWRNLKFVYSSNLNEFFIFLDGIQVDSFKVSKNVPSEMRFFVGFSGWSDLDVILRNFVLEKDTVFLGDSLDYTPVVFSSLGTEDLSHNLNDGRFNSILNNTSWISDYNPESGSRIQFSFPDNKDIYGLNLVYPDYLTISGVAIGTPSKYIKSGTIFNNDESEFRYFLLGGPEEDQLDGKDIGLFITSSGTYEPITNVSSGSIRLDIIDGIDSGTLDVLALDYLGFLGNFNLETYDLNGVLEGSVPLSWSHGVFKNSNIQNLNSYLELKSSFDYNVSREEYCEFLVNGVDFGITDPVLDSEYSVDGIMYHFAESVFKDRGQNPVWAAIKGASNKYIWRSLYGKTPVKAVFLDFDVYSHTARYKGWVDSFKFQYLKGNHDPNNNDSWVDVPTIVNSFGDPGDYKGYRDYLIANNDGEYYTNFIGIYGATSSSISLPEEVSTFLGVDYLLESYNSICVVFDNVIETEAIRFYIKSGYSTVDKNEDAAGYTFYNFNVYSSVPILYYESPVFDTDNSINSEQLLLDGSFSNSLVQMRSNDLPPEVSVNTGYERWETLSDPIAITETTNLGYNIGQGVGVYNGKAYFGFEEGLFSYDTLNQRWEFVDDYMVDPDSSDSLKFAPFYGSYVLNSAVIAKNGVMYIAGERNTILKYRIEPDEFGNTGWGICSFLRGNTEIEASMVYDNNETIYFFSDNEGTITSFNIITEKLELVTDTIPFRGFDNRSYYVPAFYSGKFYLAGGEFGSNNYYPYLDIYDIINDSWEVSSECPFKISRSWSIYSDGFIYVFPLRLLGRKPTVPVLKYNIEQDSWEVCTPLCYNREFDFAESNRNPLGNDTAVGSYFKIGGYIYLFTTTPNLLQRTGTTKSQWESGAFPYYNDYWNLNFYKEYTNNSYYLPQGRYLQFKILCFSSADFLSTLRRCSVCMPKTKLIPARSTSSFYMKTNIGSNRMQKMWYTFRHSNNKSSVILSESFIDLLPSVTRVATDYTQQVNSISYMSYANPTIILDSDVFKGLFVKRLLSTNSSKGLGIYKSESTSGVFDGGFYEVIPVGFEGSADSFSVSFPVICILPDGVYISYTAVNSTGKQSILMTKTTDFTVFQTPTVILTEGNGPFDCMGVARGTVSYSTLTNKYYLIYEGTDEEYRKSIVVCESDNLSNWNNFKTLLIYDLEYPYGYGMPELKYDGVLYRIWFVGYKKDCDLNKSVCFNSGNIINLFYTESNDLITLTDKKLVLPENPGYFYEEGYVESCCVVNSSLDVYSNDGLAFRLFDYST